MALWRSLASILGIGDEAERSDPSCPVSEDNADLEPGQVVGEYVVEQKLGEGGFGAVYRAIHPVIGKAAAVKVLHPQYSSNANVVSRFVSEARAVNQIRHRHIIDIFSFGSLADGRHYYVMELLEGVTLDDYLDHTGKLEPHEALPILAAVAKALEAAHDAGIAHRDLKPENIFLAVDDDGAVFPKILDFGVAKLLTLSGPGPMHKTHTGTPIGTPRYMSPEQCQGKKVDHRTDVYSFGVIAYRMLTGRLPFDANTALELMLMHVGTPPPRLSEVAEHIEPALDEPVLWMLEKEPTSRPASLSKAFDALLTAAKGAGVGSEPMRISIPPDVREAIQSARTASRRSDRLTPGGFQTPARQPEAIPSPAASSDRTTGKRLLALGAIIALAGLVTFVLTSQSPDASNPVATVSSLPAPPASPSVPSASAAPETSAAPSASVSWTFDTQPQDANVFLGDQLLGKAPGPFFVRRTDRKRTVIIKAAGFEEEELQLDGSSDRIVSVQLKRRAQRPSRPDVPKDLEYPF